MKAMMDGMQFDREGGEIMYYDEAMEHPFRTRYPGCEGYSLPLEWITGEEKPRDQWYHKIPDCGILCRVKDSYNADWRIGIVQEYVDRGSYKYKAGLDFFEEAEPLKEVEVKALLKAAMGALK
jgi:hypothetical protein